MKNHTEDIDNLIKETLTEEEAKFYDELDEQNILQMILGLFRGKNKWIMYMMNIVTLVVFGLFIYCAVQFFNTDVTNELIKWSIIGTFCMLIVSMLKMYIWMQMDKNAILREMKRLELQVSSLSGKLSE
jgi:cell division protein FtsL